MTAQSLSPIGGHRPRRTGLQFLAIVEAIVNEERNPRQLARLRDNRIKADEATIAQSREGHWREEHIFELTQARELYRSYQGKIAECDREIETQLERLEDRSVDRPPPAHVNKRGQGNAPRFDIRTHLYRMTGVDLARIDVVDVFAANALYRSHSALGAFRRRKKAQLGAPKAITATAHKLARLIYSMLRYGQEYVHTGLNTTRHNISSARCARRSDGRLNWAID